jgi:hypothetical protein
MAQSVKEIKFVAVARRSDKTILASRIHTMDKSYDYVQNVTVRHVINIGFNER